MRISTRIQVGTNQRVWSLTGWAELGESSSVAPGDRSAGRTELDARQRRHIVAQNCLSELDRVGDHRSRRLSLGIETLGKIL